MKIRSIVGIVIVGIALSVVAIIITTNEPVDENRLRIAYFPNVGHIVPIVGIEKGFFVEEIGSEYVVETRLFDSGPQVIEALFADSVDMAYVGPGPAINGFLNSEKNDLKILSGAASGGVSFIVHPDSDIITVSDFAGKRIAVPQIGNTQDVSLRHYLDENGLKPAERGGSVTVYNISNPDTYTLFVKGEIDGAWVAEPWASILEMELGGTRLFHEEELWPDGRFASVLLIGSTSYTQKNLSATHNLLVAHDKTIQWINQNPKESRDIFNQFLTDTLGQPLSDKIVDAALSNLEITSDPIPESIHMFAKRADKLNYLGRNGYDLFSIFWHDNDPYNIIGGLTARGLDSSDTPHSMDSNSNPEGDT